MGILSLSPKGASMGGAHTEPVLTTVRGVVLRGVFVFPARNAGEGPSSPVAGGRTEEEAKHAPPAPESGAGDLVHDEFLYRSLHSY